MSGQPRAPPSSQRRLRFVATIECEDPFHPGGSWGRVGELFQECVPVEREDGIPAFFESRNHGDAPPLHARAGFSWETGCTPFRKTFAQPPRSPKCSRTRRSRSASWCSATVRTTRKWSDRPRLVARKGTLATAGCRERVRFLRQVHPRRPPARDHQPLLHHASVARIERLADLRRDQRRDAFPGQLHDKCALSKEREEFAVHLEAI